MTEYIDELRAMWDDALAEAVRNRANKNAAENGDGKTVWAKYSLHEFSDGTKFVDVQTDQKIFDGLAADEMRTNQIEVRREGHRRGKPRLC